MNNKSNNKLSKLKSIELNIQEFWENNIPIEPEIDYDREKFFITFPYPYMNGKLHLGHAFTITKAEFTARFQRMLGKNVLFPFGFHGTGMPILACANKLSYELEKYGKPPVFPNNKEYLNDKKSSKLIMKEGNEKYQWNILKNMGVSNDDIYNFTNPEYWLEYFPKQAIKDLKKFGTMIDWRRSFITTSKNPYYDSFVKWQFRKLNNKKKLIYGSRNVIYSVKDQSPCCDHDRNIGEGINPKKYLFFKFKILNELFKDLTSDKVYILASFFNNEINDQISNVCFNPKQEYFIYIIDGEYYITSNIIAKNLYHQDFKIDFIKRLETEKILELKIQSPFSQQILFPISVSSEDNYNGFFIENSITMNQDTVNFDANNCLELYLPENKVISRSGDECIVKLSDQWFINYGNEKWKRSIKLILDNLKTNSKHLRNSLNYSVNWLDDWPCSRNHGLGTRMPNDQNVLIDSLSDSTIYMAYYTVSHLIQGNLEGSESGILGIKNYQINDTFWDNIFKESSIKNLSYHVDSTKIMKLKHEYMYWYPVDLRVSGKDLINNHLTMSIFNHEAVLGEYKCPKSYYVNGHLNLNGNKMSKSTGNFLTLEDSINKYSADVTRLVLGLAGDEISDSNFDEVEAKSMVLKLSGLIDWYKKTLNNLPKSYNNLSYLDRIFNFSMNKYINKTREAYINMKYREGIIYALFEMQNIRDKYLKYNKKPNSILILKFMKMQLLLLAPIIPHTTQYLWSLFNESILMIQAFPSYMNEDENFLRTNDYIDDLISNINKIKNKKNNYEKINIYVSSGFKDWEKQVIKLVDDVLENNNNKFDNKKFRSNLSGDLLNCKLKDTMQFANYIVKEFINKNVNLEINLSELEIINENLDLIKDLTKTEILNIYQNDVKASYLSPKIEIL